MNASPATTLQKRIHEAFEIGVALKGFNALIEVILGTALLFFNVTDIVQTLIQNELLDDPNDFFATHLQPYAHLTPEAQYFCALYLLTHGAVKIVLVAGLLRNKLWAYPASIAVLSLFIAYQVIRFFHTHSIWLVLLTIFDLIIVWLVWAEYQRISKRQG